MRQFGLFYRKEMLEMARSYKWIWVPMVFLLLGVMQPVTTYYMPEILKHAGNMPAGTVITMPTPTAGEVLAQTLSQFGILGILVLVLSMMGAVSGERQSGVTAMIFSKPVSFISYMAAKWASMLTLTVAAFAAGYAGACYYTVQLIGSLEYGVVLQAGMMYLLYYVFVVSILLLMSAWLPNGAGVAFTTIAFLMLLSFGSSLLSRYLAWSPSRLSAIASELLTRGESLSSVAPVLWMCLCSVLLCVTLAIYQMHTQESISAKV
ncbi:ABC transporter permease subunit [Paenibacillus guangzhouensis]|uniref:ABC transporter permease subunit n=1 Tax=Paenibacillus guangzhouensis TaxID=1473112 RepID=UPI00126760A9|nr:ABC transporter permease subunit [Paenibacillus guangzhouensis]